MKTEALNLLLIDGNKQIANTLSKYLYDRFGIRISVSCYYDEESCMSHVDERSHVIILDYFANGDRNNKMGLGIFNSIKKRSPKTEVTMLTSSEGILLATEEMQRGVSNYILKRERYLHKVLLLFNRMILSPAYRYVIFPIDVRIVVPIRKIIEDYTLKNYLTMFIVAFVSVGVLVFLGLKIFK